jgi:hypothetical protein
MYGTSSSESAAVGLSRLGFRGDTVLPVFLAVPPVVVALAATRKTRHTVTGRRVSAGVPTDLADIDALWAASPRAGATMMVRDAQFIREHLAFVPHRSYSLLVSREGDAVTGYLLSRTLPAGSFRRFERGRIGLVSDFHVLPGAADALVPMLGAAAVEMLRSGAVAMAVLTTRPVVADLLTKLGFVSKHLPLFGRFLRRLGSRALYWSAEPVPPFEQWHVTFADNDMDLVFGSAVE